MLYLPSRRSGCLSACNKGLGFARSHSVAALQGWVKDQLLCSALCLQAKDAFYGLDAAAQLGWEEMSLELGYLAFRVWTSNVCIPSCGKWFRRGKMVPFSVAITKAAERERALMVPPKLL